MVVDTLISLGIMGILIFIASKLEVINHNTDMIVNFLMGGGNPPRPPPSGSGNVG